ncbi:hypothetical protein ACOSQ2_024583 [Xanthoceras sorbifolium]
MIPSDFFAYGSVLVQRHTVTLIPELVSEYFQLPDILELQGGWEEHAFFHPYDYDLAEALIIEDSRWWHVRNTPRLYQEGVAHDDEDQEQDLGYQDGAPQEQDHPQVQASLEERMDIMEASIIGLEARLTTRMDAMEASIERINSTLFQTYARCQAGPS